MSRRNCHARESRRHITRGRRVNARRSPQRAELLRSATANKRATVESHVAAAQGTGTHREIASPGESQREASTRLTNSTGHQPQRPRAPNWLAAVAGRTSPSASRSAKAGGGAADQPARSE